MFLITPIVRSLYLARLRLPEAVRGRLFPSTRFRISILLDAPNPARRDRGPFTAAADKTRRVPSSGSGLLEAVARDASRLLLAAHERTGLDERPIAPNKQVAYKRHAEF